MSMNNILTIEVKAGTEPCNVDVDKMHETLLQLPAEKYIELYHTMRDRIEGSTYYCIDDSLINPQSVAKALSEAKKMGYFI